MGSHGPIDPKKAPVQFKPKPAGSADIIHQSREFASGSRGGGSVPSDFGWATNPKQHQEERGAADADKPIS